MSALATVRDDSHGEVPIVTIEGEIDSSNAGEIGVRLRAPVTNRTAALVVDLTPTTYLDSAGLNLLFELDAELRERQQQMHLVVEPTSPITRMIQIVGLDIAVPTHATREAAVLAVETH
jgi:anti-sigma B factor antagonist